MGYDHVLEEQEKQELLRIARSTLREHLDAGRIPPGRPHKKTLLLGGGAFVTLKRQDGELRGCIGTFEDKNPIYQTVQQMAVSAATRDPRFPPVDLEELESCVIEISVLSSLEEADAEDVQVGRHGLQISRGFARGVLLPQVPVEWGWDRKTFLEQVCLKAGLPPDAYLDPSAKLFVFTAQVFGEKDEQQYPSGP